MNNKIKNQFIASYLFDDKNTGEGVEWGLQFYAKDMEEAKQRIKAIKETLHFDGELSEIISAEED